MTSTREEIRIGGIAVRFLLQGEASGGSVAMFEFDVAAGAKVPIAHSHDAYEETIYGLEGVLDLHGGRAKNRHGPGRGSLHRSRSGPSLRQL